MKNTFKYIATFVAFSAAALVTGSAVSAQNLVDGTYMEQNGIAFAKRSTINDDGTYTVDLETFVTGEVTQTYEAVPVDVVLVLDVSGSMDEAISTVSSYEEANVNGLYGSNYNNNNPTQYYYQYNNNYYALYIGRGGTSGNRRYYLFFRVGGTTYYINTNGQVVTQQPTNVTSTNTNLLASNVQLYTQVTTTTTKMDALKSAVEAFISQIAHNDWFEDDTDTKPRSQALGNQISIVKFAEPTYYVNTTSWVNGASTTPTTEPGNHFPEYRSYNGQYQYRNFSTNYYESAANSRYNATEVLCGFTSTATESNVTNIKSSVTSIIAAGSTAADYGMNLAYLLINGLGADRANSSKTVVFFTDGAPTHAANFDSTVASNAISNANSIKAITYGSGDNATHPIIYSVGIFSGNASTQINNFMTSVATDSSHYINASGGSAEDLKDIFTEIAHNAGGSGNTQVSGGSSLTVDIVSSSFSVPKGFEENPAGAIEVYVARCTGVTTIDGQEYLTFGPELSPSSIGLTIEPSISETDNKVSTTGFDYSANWCGPDPTSQGGYHGYKQIIRFQITLNEDAVGGPAVETNDPNSGIYLPGATEPIIKFNRPTVKIPVQIWIQKVGLQGEDTAVFNLRRTPFVENFDPETAVWESGATWGTKIVIGPDDYDQETGMYLKKQVGLDPDYYYKIEEDAWAFGYTYQLGGVQYTFGDNIQNPFTFTNVPNNKKFDEAKARNVFTERKSVSPPPSSDK